MTLAFDSEKLDASSFDQGGFFVASSSIFKWKNTIYTNEFDFTIDWNNRIYAEEFDLAIDWNGRLYTSEYPFKFNWVNVSGLAWPLVDYLSVKTIQDEYLFPEIIDGKISLKEGSIAEATFDLKSFVPEDSRCTFYLRGSTRMFDGNSRRCVENEKGIFKLTVQEYLEILKPESDKGGVYLVKNNWNDVELHNLLSSAKPADNDNEIGLLYMAFSAIPWQFFEEHDEENNIFKFEYTGTAYTITEVYEDSTLLTAKASVADLESASGWYHDTSNKILYVRCTDQVYPYFHVISVPYIWDFKIPIRIGNITDQSSTVIAYWETANGDIPLTTLKNILTALGLEMETSIRGGICYIDVSSKIGSGTSSSPTKYYIEGENILKIKEIDRADARNMISGVGFLGYGQGAGAVRAGAHINMNRGGRFIFLDDPSVHSQASAEGYVENYLDDHFLPARRIKFSAPVEIGDAIDQRRLGDYTHISLPSRKIEDDLRVQEISLNLKPLSMDLVTGDKLISYDQKMKAMRDAAEKFRKHLQDEVEEFTWNWTENIISNANLSNKFTITADALKIQKLELSVSTNLFRTDAMQGAGGGGGGGAGDGTSGGEEDPTAMTGNGEEHTHGLIDGEIKGGTGGPSGTIQVSAKGHTHTYSSTSGSPSATSVVTESVDEISVETGCCTGVACGKEWVSEVTGASSNTISVASSGHTHSISGTTSGDDSYEYVATYDHTHDITSLYLTSESNHRHPISENGYNPTVATSEDSEIPVDPETSEPYSNWQTAEPGETGHPQIAADIYKAFFAPGSDPEMYFTVKISGPGITGSVEITGSPYVIKVNDSFGPTLIDNLVTEAGEYTVTVGLSNKDTPADKAKINFSMQINGVIFVDTIIKE